MKPESISPSTSSIAVAIEALSSCAIEGSQLAIELLELRKTDFGEFMRRCIKAGFIRLDEGEAQ